MKRLNFADGETIFRQGDRSDAAYLIMEGEVEIVREARDGSAEVIAVLGRGDYFGEMGAIDDQPRSASARAKRALACMSVERAEFMDMLLTRPQEAIQLLKILFERLRRTNAKLARLRKS